jgi:hypothetical protein
LELSHSLAHKYKTRVEVTDSDQHPSLLAYGINYGRKSFQDQVTGDRCNKHFLNNLHLRAMSYSVCHSQTLP